MYSESKFQFLLHILIEVIKIKFNFFNIGSYSYELLTSSWMKYTRKKIKKIKLYMWPWYKLTKYLFDFSN